MGVCHYACSPHPDRDRRLAVRAIEQGLRDQGPPRCRLGLRGGTRARERRPGLDANLSVSACLLAQSGKERASLTLLKGVFTMSTCAHAVALSPYPPAYGLLVAALRYGLMSAPADNGPFSPSGRPVPKPAAN